MKKHQKIFFLIVILNTISIYHLMAFTLLKDTTKLISQERLITGFDSITVAAAVDIKISQGSSESVKVTVPEANILNYVVTKLQKRKLSISLVKNDKYNWGNWGTFNANSERRPNHITIYITVKHLEAIQLSNSAVAYISGNLTGKSFKLDLNESAAIYGQLYTPKLTVTIYGSAHATINGQANTVNLKMDGSSVLDAEQLSTKDMSVSLEGNSIAKIKGYGKITGQASGNSCLIYDSLQFTQQISTTGRATIKKAKSE